MSMTEDQMAHLLALHIATSACIANVAGLIASADGRTPTAVKDDLQAGTLQVVSAMQMNSHDPDFDPERMKSLIATQIRKLFEFQLEQPKTAAQ